jgi:hypothetical protein
MAFLRIFLLFSLLSLAFSHEAFNSHVLPRPLILEYPENAEIQFKEFAQELRLQCTSWRFAAETNNLSPWKTIPQECVDYVKDYMMGRAYSIDVERVSKEAGVFAKSVKLSEDGKDAWVFDVDETLLSNLPYYAEHGYGYHSGSSSSFLFFFLVIQLHILRCCLFALKM